MRTDIGHRIYIHNTNCSLVKSSGTNLHTLRLRVTHGCNRIDLRTRIRIEPKLWDKRKQKVRQGYNVNGNTYNDINTTINTYMQYIDGYFHECELMKREPVLTDLRAKFNYTFKQTNAQRSSEFFLLFDEFIKEANQAAAEGIRCVHPNAEIVEVPVSDGGEGSADRQTLMGKLPMGILAQSGRVPVCLIAGKISDREQLLQAGFAHVECINPPGFSLEEAMRKEVAQQRIQRLLIGILDHSA